MDPTFYPYLYLILAIWEIVLKGFALWRAAKLGHKYWYIALLIINSVGILPLVYLLIYTNPKVMKKITALLPQKPEKKESKEK